MQRKLPKSLIVLMSARRARMLPSGWQVQSVLAHWPKLAGLPSSKGKRHQGPGRRLLAERRPGPLDTLHLGLASTWRDITASLLIVPDQSPLSIFNVVALAGGGQFDASGLGRSGRIKDDHPVIVVLVGDHLGLGLDRLAVARASACPGTRP